MRKPVIGVCCDRVLIGDHRFHAVGEKYLLPLAHFGALPRLIPSLPGVPTGDLLQGLDGLLLTGAVSNIEPRHYGSEDRDCAPFDPDRDAVTLPLSLSALAMDLPLLAICRGLQELNVALGGSLHPRLHDVPGRSDHRAPTEGTPDDHYAPRHEVRLTKGGALAGWADGQDRLQVNSLHGQGIHRLADRLCVEATAPDGSIEAVRVADRRTFAIGIQWHPEWRFAENAFSSNLFRAFVGACA